MNNIIQNNIDLKIENRSDIHNDYANSMALRLT